MGISKCHSLYSHALRTWLRIFKPSGLAEEKYHDNYYNMTTILACLNHDLVS
jgi:hypothetical protein